MDADDASSHEQEHELLSVIQHYYEDKDNMRSDDDNDNNDNNKNSIVNADSTGSATATPPNPSAKTSVGPNDAEASAGLQKYARDKAPRDNSSSSHPSRSDSFQKRATQALAFVDAADDDGSSGGNGDNGSDDIDRIDGGRFTAPGTESDTNKQVQADINEDDGIVNLDLAFTNEVGPSTNLYPQEIVKERLEGSTHSDPDDVPSMRGSKQSHQRPSHTYSTASTMAGSTTTANEQMDITEFSRMRETEKMMHMQGTATQQLHQRYRGSQEKEKQAVSSRVAGSKASVGSRNRAKFGSVASRVHQSPRTNSGPVVGSRDASQDINDGAGHGNAESVTGVSSSTGGPHSDSYEHALEAGTITSTQGVDGAAPNNAVAAMLVEDDNIDEIRDNARRRGEDKVRQQLGAEIVASKIEVVEENKPGSDKRRLGIVLAIACVAAIALALGLVFGLSSDDTEPTLVSFESRVPTAQLEPTQAPSLFPSSQPSFATAPPTQQETLLRNSLIRQVAIETSGAEYFSGSNSTRQDALDWMINEDVLTVSNTTESIIKERYIVTLAYLSMTGELLTLPNKFLSANLTTCEWGSDINPARQQPFIQCDDDGRVTSLHFREAGLIGTFLHELGALERLQFFDFASNGMSGHLPTELGDLTNLVYFDISLNNIDGILPTEFDKMVSLQALHLFWNPNLGGVLPSSFSRLQSLQVQGTNLTDLQNICGPGNMGGFFLSNCFEDDVECTCCQVCCTAALDFELCGPPNAP